MADFDGIAIHRLEFDRFAISENPKFDENAI